jgi:hypothetical protein
VAQPQSPAKTAILEQLGLGEVEERRLPFIARVLDILVAKGGLAGHQAVSVIVTQKDAVSLLLLETAHDVMDVFPGGSPQLPRFRRFGGLRPCWR